MPQRSIRFSDRVSKEVDDVSRARGFASAAAFIRYAVDQELSERQAGLTGAEERIAATLNQVRKDVSRVARAQQALFAYLDTFAKALLTLRAGAAGRRETSSRRARQRTIRPPPQERGSRHGRRIQTANGRPRRRSRSAMTPCTF